MHIPTGNACSEGNLLREYIPPMLQRTSKKQKIPKRFLKIYAR
jgi:hypothetical protein